MQSTTTPSLRTSKYIIRLLMWVLSLCDRSLHRTLGYELRADLVGQALHAANRGRFFLTRYLAAECLDLLKVIIIRGLELISAGWKRLPTTLRNRRCNIASVLWERATA